uniref:Uncharacterized protein n=1 Tax=Mustela putorius furo TaxID=9669 RepID=M3Y322_MUSPF
LHRLVSQPRLPERNATDWIAETTEIYFLTVLEAGSLRSGCKGLGSALSTKRVWEQPHPNIMDILLARGQRR